MRSKRKECKSIKELKDLYQKIDLVWDTQQLKFMIVEILFIAESLEKTHSLIYQELVQVGRVNRQLEILTQKLSLRRKRKVSPYQLRLGQFLKKGKTIQEAHKLARGES
ncbi:MAG: hypothetical protein E3J87_09010 [Candidatus Cloacimonadota bacterium]|nr:MAG: hypothetical protein E3J87_09010 [Candidatus Cloacimonadota bacterium]